MSMQPYTEIMQGEAKIAGVLLHPTSLPSGQLDEDVFNWIDFMADAGLRLWQVLPLGVPQGNLSPYQCYSAFAINPVLMPLETEITDEQAKEEDFLNWSEHERYWLDDYALFTALKLVYSQQAWYKWPELIKIRDPVALAEFRQQHQQAVKQVYWQQYQLYRRWQEVREYATKKGIYLFGDMPIFVAHDSADVWANQNCFLLDKEGMPTVVAGVPPDYFSETGQRWGNPHYNWEVMGKNGYSWWLKRLQNHLQCFDVVRIDHFRGLEAVWVIDADQETAVKGVWQEVPGNEMLQALQDDMGTVSLVAEDLGIITEKVTALREQFHLPGMSVLQFSFDESEDNPHKPENITHDRIVYTGTHDNDTSLGWFWSLNDDTRRYVLQKMNVESATQVCYRLIDMALESKAQLAVIPMQDLLCLDSNSRMNIPGTTDGNWRWQFSWDQLTDDMAKNLKLRIQALGR